MTDITVGSITFGQILTHDELPDRFTSLEAVAKSDAIPERKAMKQEALIEMLRWSEAHLIKENESLRAQLAKCQKEKQELALQALAENTQAFESYDQLTAAQADITRLSAALEEATGTCIMLRDQVKQYQQSSGRPLWSLQK